MLIKHSAQSLHEYPSVFKKDHCGYRKLLAEIHSFILIHLIEVQGMIVTAILTASTIMAKKYIKNNQSASTNFKNVSAVLFNIAVSISIVLTNKWVYSVVKFPNMTLTFLHFVSTFLCLHLCQLMRFFSIKHVPLKSMIPLACFFCGFVVLTNLSLENNSVGTYQVAKVMTTPCVLLIQFYFYGKLTTRGTLITVVSWKLLLFVLYCILY